MSTSQAQSISTNGPKHHIYPNTTPPNRKYNPIPPDITPESSASVSSNSNSMSHSQHSIATLNAVAPPSLGLPLSMSSTMSSHAMSMESSKHGSPTVSPSPSSVGGPEASPTTSSEGVVTPPHGMDMTETADIPDGAGEYLEKSIAFGGGQALPFAIEEEEEEEPVDTNANANVNTNTDATTPSSSSFYSTVSPEGPGSRMQKAERTRSLISVVSKSRTGANLSKRSIKGRSLRKRIKRMFSSSKRFKAGDRVEI